MDWLWKLLISYIAHFCLTTFIIPSTYALQPGFLNGGPYIRDMENSIEDQNIENSIKVLSSVLLQAWPRGMSPLVYIDHDVEDPSTSPNRNSYTPFEYHVPVDRNVQDKRSKYYRKYPLKRQNRYSRYDAENRYMCLPSREDVFRLLVALHETKQGTRENSVNFCNRRRPAKTVFTNIRFFGK